MMEEAVSKPVSKKISVGNRWRIARWTIALSLLLAPLIMMQFNSDWNWTLSDFLFAAIAIGSVGLLYELAEKMSIVRAYRIGSAISLGSCFLLVWSTLVRDDGHGVGFFLIVMGAGVGGFAGQLEAGSLARTMLGVALMQALFGLAVATAPVVARIPGASIFYLFYSLVFCTLWLTAAACFRIASQSD